VQLRLYRSQPKVAEGSSVFQRIPAYGSKTVQRCYSNRSVDVDLLEASLSISALVTGRSSRGRSGFIVG
jgi:hypothetical protein